MSKTTEAEAAALVADKFAETPSTELAVQQTAVERVTTALSDAEWDDVEDGHLGGTVQPRLPRLLLNRKAGQTESGFTDELTGERFMSSQFVWLADTMTRAWWPLPFGKGDKEPACRSRDGINADPSAPAQQDGWQLPPGASGVEPPALCAECPNSSWHGEESPSCNASVEVMIYLLEQQRLSLVRFGGMAVSRVNRYLGALNAHIPRRPAIAYITSVELEAVETANGLFLVPKFAVAGEIPRAQAQPLIEMRREKVSEWQEQLAAEVAEGATREGEASAAGPFDSAGTDPTRPFVDPDEEF